MPTEMQSISENDFEYFANTGVNTPQDFPKGHRSYTHGAASTQRVLCLNSDHLLLEASSREKEHQGSHAKQHHSIHPEVT